MSTGVDAMKMPLSPPMTNIHTKASAFSIGTWNWMRPPHSVPSQLNVLMAEGTAMIIVVIMNDMPSAGFMPLMNMWWPYTTQERNAMPMIENAIAWYPKMGLRENTGRISDAIPMAGRMRMYTSGCPKYQNRCCH